MIVTNKTKYAVDANGRKFVMTGEVKESVKDDGDQNWVIEMDPFMLTKYNGRLQR